MPTQLNRCPIPGCPQLTNGGRCTNHARAAEQQRGTTTQRGYSSKGHRFFRRAVLRREPICRLCHVRPSTQADHWPHSRRQLVDLGLNPNDPKYGRGLCDHCHHTETARNQPGGFNAAR